MFNLHYDQALRDKYPSVAPLPAVDSIARTNVADRVGIVCCTVELATAVSGVVLISYQFVLSSDPCILNCGAVVVIAHMFTVSCTLLAAPANNTTDVALIEFTFIALSNTRF